MKTILFSACLLMAPGLNAATAETTFVLNGLADKCAIPAGCTNEPFVAPRPEPMYYPWAYATYTTGLHASVTYRPGTQPIVPVNGTGSATIHWGDGGPNEGAVQIEMLDCRMTGTKPNYTITCTGADGQGNRVDLVHHLYLFEVRFGYWNWYDLGAKMTLTLATL